MQKFGITEDDHYPKWQPIFYSLVFGGHICDCGQPIKFRNMRDGFGPHCSSLCAGADPKVLQRRRRTSQQKYGVSHYVNAASVREKRRKTFIQRHGVEWSGQSKKLLNKMKKTMMSKYGVDHPTAMSDFQAKVKATHMERYGVEHITHTDKFHDAHSKSGFTSKTIYIQGKKFNVRGYEPQALKWLVKEKGYKPSSLIVTASGGLPFFKYMDGNKERMYRPDIFIKKSNVIIEVKSTYTLGLNRTGYETFRRVKIKAKAVERDGYDFRLLLVHTNGSVQHLKNFTKLTRKQVLSMLA